MADNVVGKLVFKVDVDSDEAKKSMDSFSESVEDATKETESADTGISKSFENISAKAVAMAVAVGAAFIKVSKEIAGAVGEIESGQKTIAYATGATGSDLENLMDSAKKVFAQSDDTFEDVSKAIGEINTRLGLTGETLESTTALFLDFAKATGQDVQQSVIEVTQTMNRWGLDLEDLPSLLDKLTVAGQASGISVSELSSSLTDNAGTFQAFGYDIDEATALLMTLEKQGINSSEVIMAMKKSFQDSATAGTDARADWEALLDSITNATSETEANSIAIEVFGTRIATDMVQALRSGALNIDEFAESLKNAEGALTNTDNAGKTTAENFQTLKNNITLLENTIGQAFSPAINTVLIALSDMISAFNGLDDSTQTLIISLGLLVAAFAIGGPVGIAVGALGAFLIASQDNESAVKDLESAMTKLEGAMKSYKDISDKLSGSVDNLTASERALLEVQLKKAEIEIADTLKEVASTYKEVTEEATEATMAMDIQKGRLDGLNALLVGLTTGGLEGVKEQLSALKDKADEGILTTFEESLMNTYSMYLPDLESALKEGGSALDEWMLILGESIDEVYVDYVNASDDALKANVALESSLAILANAVETGVLDIEKYRKLYPQLVADIEAYIKKGDDAVSTTEETSQASKQASDAVNEYSDQVDASGEQIVESLDEVTEAVDSLSESTGEMTAEQKDAVTELGAVGTALSVILPMLDSFCDKLSASIDPIQTMYSQAEILTGAIQALSASLSELNGINVTLPSLSDVSATLEVVRQINDEMNNSGLSTGGTSAMANGLTVDNVVSDALSAGGGESARGINIHNDLNAVIEVDGTQLGIATLKNIDNASQFVVY